MKTTFIISPRFCKISLLISCLFCLVLTEGIRTEMQAKSFYNNISDNTNSLIATPTLKQTNQIIIEPQNYNQVKKMGNNDTGSALLGFVIGPILFFFSFAMTWYNQKRDAVNKRRWSKLKQLLHSQASTPKNPMVQPKVDNQDHRQTIGSVQSVNPANQKLLPKPQQNVFHLTGQVRVVHPADDNFIKLNQPKALKLVREVQVREYRKKSKKKRDPPQLEWCLFHVGQAGDKSNSSQAWFMKSEIITSKQAYINDLRMNQNELLSLQISSKIQPTPELAKNIAQNSNAKNKQFIIDDGYIYFPSAPGNRLSHGTLRVRYMISRQQQLSVIASQGPQKTLQPFRIDIQENHGQPDKLFCQDNSLFCCCHAAATMLKPITEVDIVMPGKLTAQEMVQITKKNDKACTGILRIASYFVMVFGVYIFFLPIIQILGYIPLVGGFISGTVGIFVFLAALIVCIPLFLLTFSLAWLFYNPKYGIIAVLLAVIITIIIVVLNETLKNTKTS